VGQRREVLSLRQGGRAVVHPEGDRQVSWNLIGPPVRPAHGNADLMELAFQGIQ
jgi:hypothetical protein